MNERKMLPWSCRIGWHEWCYTREYVHNDPTERLSPYQQNLTHTFYECNYCGKRRSA